MINYIKLLRIKHYIKNLLIFLPLFFSANINDFDLLLKATLGFISFSLIASVVYIVNDINDCDKDAAHPIKCKRPIASDRVSVKSALIVGFCLLVIAVVIDFNLNNFSFGFSTMIMFVYLLINIFYSLGFKNVPVIDLIILVSGFIMRVMFGGVIVGIEISNWLILTVMAMSFYLGLGKRRNELKIIGASSRGSLKFYTVRGLTFWMNVSIVFIFLFYVLWSLSSVNNYMLFSFIFVVLIVLRYNKIVNGNSDGDPVNVLLSSKSLILMVLIYAFLVCLLLYFN